MDIIYMGDISGILNTGGGGMTSYYSKKSGSFEVLCWDDVIPADYIEVPYMEEIQGCAMRSFWRKLGKDSMNMPWQRHRFFSYLQKHDLYYEYMKYEKELCLVYMKAWAEENDIVLDWDQTIIV